jgi:hypothetical protein
LKYEVKSKTQEDRESNESTILNVSFVPSLEDAHCIMNEISAEAYVFHFEEGFSLKKTNKRWLLSRH